MTSPDFAKLPDITQFDLDPLPDISLTDEILAYYVRSTAAINVEDNVVLPDSNLTRAHIDTIANHLLQNDQRQIVIAIHGYGTQRADAQRRYQKIYSHITNVDRIGPSVFLGYLWPSEKPSGDSSLSQDQHNKGDSSKTDSSFRGKIADAFNALPNLLLGSFFASLVITIVATLLLLFTSVFKGILAPVLILSVLAFGGLSTLILLRLSTYFRDNYRATNYGVLDLVELIRQLDQAIYRKIEASEGKGTKLSKKERIKLSFLAHSMGCFVATNTIRILSDVFDSNSINQNPPADIGHVFSLERLVLVAPDIPVETVLTRRANFLQSSLRRCEEAYVFSNEGDLALRLASTAANYFSFPIRTRDSGYRLGNLTAKHFNSSDDHRQRYLKQDDYGIVNWNTGKPDSPSTHLEIRVSERSHLALDEFPGYDSIERGKICVNEKEVLVADLFTYFDCTDYVDNTDNEKLPQPRSVVSFASRKAALTLVDYFLLTVSYFKLALNLGPGINVHGGYFDGVWSQQVMYGLAFLGFREFLMSRSSSDDGSLPAMEANLSSFAEQARNKGVQVVLSPVRYEKDIAHQATVYSSSTL